MIVYLINTYDNDTMFECKKEKDMGKIKETWLIWISINIHTQ